MSGNYFGGDMVAVSPIVIKAALTAAADKRVWKAIAVLIAAALMPMIITLLIIASLFAGITSENKNLLDYSFKYYSIPHSFTNEQKKAITDMRRQLLKLDDTMEKSDLSLDEKLVRAVFYCLNFGVELDKDFDYEDFCECFDEIEYGTLQVALQEVSEEFPQYENTGNLSFSVRNVYEYLCGQT